MNIENSSPAAKSITSFLISIYIGLKLVKRGFSNLEYSLICDNCILELLPQPQIVPSSHNANE